MSETQQGPNPFAVAWSVVKALLSTRRPAPQAVSAVVVDTSGFAESLDSLARKGLASLPDLSDSISEFVGYLATIRPDQLSRNDALAYWLNLYNAGALLLAAKAAENGASSVLRVPGGFGKTFVTVGSEHLSLDAVEHAKLRRFKDPRVHGALVCGSASCPTLRYEPFTGDRIDEQLDDQLRSFFANGGAAVVDNTLYLSRILKWFGGDFVLPQRMPSFVPAPRRTVAKSLIGWLPAEAAAVVDSGGRIEFQPYDWSLSCSIG